MKPYINAPKHHQVGGWIEFCEGSENIFNNANYLVEPMLADYYLFPANLKHFVYPFKCKGERRSMSFNADMRLQ